MENWPFMWIHPNTWILFPKQFSYFTLGPCLQLSCSTCKVKVPWIFFSPFFIAEIDLNMLKGMTIWLTHTVYGYLMTSRHWCWIMPRQVIGGHRDCTLIKTIWAEESFLWLKRVVLIKEERFEALHPEPFSPFISTGVSVWNEAFLKTFICDYLNHISFYM